MYVQFRVHSTQDPADESEIEPTSAGPCTALIAADPAEQPPNPQREVTCRPSRLAEAGEGEI